MRLATAKINFGPLSFFNVDIDSDPAHNKTQGLVVALFGLFLASVPVWAHHSVTAEFDPKKNFTITGTLKKLDWTNPHIYVWVEAKGENGQAVTYGVEASPPGMLHRAGVTRDTRLVGKPDCSCF